jgi:hypothetical protein
MVAGADNMARQEPDKQETQMAHDDESGDCKFDSACYRTVERLSKIVCGNGHPEDSLIVQVKQNRHDLVLIKRMSWATLTGVVALVGKILFVWVETMVKT